ncbi:MAG: ankyrin repeat domain-containing protein [Rhizobiaceae bacterium]
MKQLAQFFISLIILLIFLPLGVAADPLHEAAAKGDFSAVTAALKSGADVNAYDKNGKTALFVAAEEDQAAIISLLAKHGAEVNAYKKSTYPNQAAAIHTAVKRNNLKAIQALADAGADLTLFSYELGAPLHIATIDGLTDAASLLRYFALWTQISLKRLQPSTYL